MVKKGVCSSLTLMVLVLLMAILLVHVQDSHANPLHNRRVKRISDQRLAELVTQIGLKNYQGQLITVPVANGINFKQIGRKRRSQQNLLAHLFNTSEEDNGEPEAAAAAAVVSSDLLQQLQRRYERLQQQQQHDVANVDDAETPFFYVRKR